MGCLAKLLTQLKLIIYLIIINNLHIINSDHQNLAHL